MTQRLSFPAPAIVTRQPVVRIDEASLDVVALPFLPAAWQCDLADDSLRWDSGVFDLFGLARDTRLERPAAVEMYTDHSRRMRVTADTVVAGGRVTHLYGTKQDITDEPLSGSDELSRL